MGEAMNNSDGNGVQTDAVLNTKEARQFLPTLYCLPMGGLKPPASAGSFEHEPVPLGA